MSLLLVVGNLVHDSNVVALKTMSYASLITRNPNGLHPNFRGLPGRGLGFLGDTANPTLTAEAAMQQAIAAYGGKNLNPKQFQNSGWLAQAANVIETTEFSVAGGFGPDCAGQTAQPLNLFKTASGLALSTTAATTGILSATSVIPAAAVPVIGWVVAGVGAIISLIGAIFQHHAAAVARDLQFGCSAIPAVNNAFAVIRQGVQDGTIKAADAATALPQIYEHYMSAGGASGSASGPGGIPSGGTAINDSPWCNSNCELSVVLLAMVFYWQAQFQALAAQQAYEAQQAAAASQSSASSAPSAPAPSVSQGGSQVPVVAAGANVTLDPALPSSGQVGTFSFSEIPPWGWIAIALFGAWAIAG